MTKPFISLCPEITRADALTLMDWLEDESVTRYLSDSRHVSRFIEDVIGRVQLPVLTHLFNQGGRFVSGNRAAFLPTSSAGGDRIEADWLRSVASTALG